MLLELITEDARWTSHFILL